MKDCAIIIPIFKSEVSEEEVISLSSLTIFEERFDIIYVVPERLDISKHLQMISPTYIFEFDKKYFDGFEGYNCLLTSSFFYSRFRKYEYILICQLDVLILNDNLSTFIKLGYDYIGSPIPKMHPWEKRFMVGNGGLSLRKVRSFLDLLKNLEKNNLLIGMQNEDVFFSLCCENENYSICSAPISIAMKFAYDQPYFDLLNRMNGNNLPLGIHAWFRYDTSNSRNELMKYVPADFVWKNDCLYSEILCAIDKFLEQSSNLYLWGAGDIGMLFLDYCHSKMVEVRGFLVSDEKKIESKYKNGIPVLHLSDMNDIVNCTVVVTISSRYRNNENYLSVLAKKDVKSSLQLSFEMILALENFLLEKENSQK